MVSLCPLQTLSTNWEIRWIQVSLHLVDGGLLVVYESVPAATVVISLDDCKPYRIFWHYDIPNASYIFCSVKSAIVKFALQPVAHLVGTTAQAKSLGAEYLNVAAVPLFDSESGKIGASFVHYHNLPYEKTWLSVVADIDINIHSVICSDTWYINESCANPTTSINLYNNTHFVLECASTKNTVLRFLIYAFSTAGDCEGFIPIDLNDGIGSVAPDHDTFAVNLGTFVEVKSNELASLYNCVINNQKIDGIDFVMTTGGVIILLFTSSGIFTCNQGMVQLLASSPILEGFSYYIHQELLFVISYSSTSSLYMLSIYDVVLNCQLRYPNAVSITTAKKPLHFVFWDSQAPPMSSFLVIPTVTLLHAPSTIIHTGITMGTILPNSLISLPGDVPIAVSSNGALTPTVSYRPSPPNVTTLLVVVTVAVAIFVSMGLVFIFIVCKLTKRNCAYLKEVEKVGASDGRIIGNLQTIRIQNLSSVAPAHSSTVLAQPGYPVEECFMQEPVEAHTNPEIPPTGSWCIVSAGAVVKYQYE